jgi:hypothetical protein
VNESARFIGHRSAPSPQTPAIPAATADQANPRTGRARVGTVIESHANVTSIQAIYRFDVAKKVPLGGKISFKDLAKQCDLYEPDLRRIIRFAITFHRHIQEPRPGIVSHSAYSRLLLEDSDLRDGVGLMFNEWSASYGRVS